MTSTAQKYPPTDQEFASRAGISPDEWKRVVDGLGRPPNEYECLIFAKLWSDECSAKSGKMFLRTVFRDGMNVVRLVGRRSGIVEIGFGEALALRFEQSNSQGLVAPAIAAEALLASVVDDLTATGAQDIVAFDLIRVGDHESTRSHIFLRSAVDGFSDFSTRAGIPIVGGELLFHPRYEGTSILNCGAVGVVSSEKIFRTGQAKAGDVVLYVGAKTDRDGTPLDGRPRLKHADPLYTDLLTHFLADAISAGMLIDIAPIGIGGIARTVFDIAGRINTGLSLLLDQIPVRQSGLTPAEVLFSETPNRFVLITSHDNYRELSDILTPAGIPILLIGEVAASSEIQLSWQHHPLATIPYKIVWEELIETSYQLSRFPPMLRNREKADRTSNKQHETPIREELDRLDDVWLDMLASPNVCSRSGIFRRFDQRRGGNTLAGAGGDAAVLRLKAEEDGNRPPRAIAVTIDSNSIIAGADAYLGGVQTVAEAMRNLAATGATPVGAAQCMNFGDPTDYRQISDFSECVRGVSDACRAWEIPIVSESISFRNGAPGVPILPTPAVMMVGVIRDAALACSVGFQNRGDTILLLGTTREEFGASEYYTSYRQLSFGTVPDIDFALEKKTCELVYDLVHEGLLHSAHDLSSGGLAIALAECCLERARPIGAKLTLSDLGICDEAYLFSETSARFLVSCAQNVLNEVRAACEKFEVPITGEGTVGGKEIVLEGVVSCAVPVSTAQQLWSGGLHHILGLV